MRRRALTKKLAFCRENGADETINYSTEDLKARVKELTGGKGVDVVYDPVGGDLAEAALRASGWDARYLVIGFASGPIPKIPLNLALLNSRNILGVFWGAWAGRFPREKRGQYQGNLRHVRSGQGAPARVGELSAR